MMTGHSICLPISDHIRFNPRWTAQEFYELKMRDEDFAVSLPGGKEYLNHFVEEWLRRFSKSPQFIG